MPLDGFVIHALVDELSVELSGARINKIYQPDKYELVFVVRQSGKTHNLLISAHPTYPRLHLTEHSYVNPQQPPLFCMLLRKHIEGGIISSVKQVDNERIIHIDIATRDEIGDPQSFRLVIEIMGRHSNIMLLNDHNTVLDSITRVTQSISRFRQVLPGKEYISPPAQGKLNPFTLDEQSFNQLVEDNESNYARELVNKLMGLSLPLANELISQTEKPLTKQKVWTEVSKLLELTKKREYHPTIVQYNSKEDFSLIPLTYLNGNEEHFDSMNSCLDNFYRNKAEHDTVKQRAADLLKFINNERQKNEKKLKYLNSDLIKADSADKYRLYGELLTASLHSVPLGASTVLVTNYYGAEGEQIEIPLNNLLSPNANAQAYFKRYSKLKKSREHLEEQIKLTIAENEYLDLLLTQIENAGVSDILEIREELIAGGYIKKNKTKQKHRRKTVKPQLLEFTSSEGIPILVGRNNTQNDYLTTKLGNANDTWLHTKNIPGSHVVIRSNNFNEKTLTEAAVIAAYYSKAKFSSNVPVDYTLLRNVRKPSGVKPGYVTYDQQNTVFVTPDQTIIDKLISKK